MARRRTTRLILTGLLLALSALPWVDTSRCAHANSPALHAPPIPFTWQRSTDDEARLYDRIKMLRYGDSLMRVKALLGPPTREEDFANKRGNHRRRGLLYAIRRVRPEGGNTYDQEIQLIFGDQSHRLLEIWYSNMLPLNGDIIRTIDVPGTAYFTKPPMP